MTPQAEPFITRVATLTGERARAVSSAFVELARESWPNTEVVRAFARAQTEATTVDVCQAILRAFDVAHAEYPAVMFWWKNERSEFLGFCPRFARASGLLALDLLGRTDADPAVTWNRQAAVYMRDDREVLRTGTAKLDILERQDRGEVTVWLRTSKVPYQSPHGSGTVGGFDTITAAEALRLSKKRS